MRSNNCVYQIGIGLGLAAIACCQLSVAEDWTQWRGNNRDGKSSETGLLDSWPEEGPELLWQSTKLGNGYSTPSAAQGRVFLIRNMDESSEEVIALSLKDGSQSWATRIGKVGRNNGPQYPGSRSTPTIDGNLLYALGSDGDLACLETQSGVVRWSLNLRNEFAGKPGAWAYTESPLLDGEKLICSPGGADSTVVALNKTDGSVIWKSALEAADDASFSSPIIATINGQKQYVLFLSKGAIGLDASNGKELWRYTKTSDQQANIQTPVASDGYVYTAASRVGGGLVQINPGQGDPQEIYFAKSMPSGMGGSLLVDGNLFGASGDTLMCIDYRSGQVKWQDRSIGAASLCFADGKLFLHGDNNDVAMVAASGDGYQELGRFTPSNAPTRARGTKAWTYPIIVDGKLIIRDVGSVWCYNISN